MKEKRTKGNKVLFIILIVLVEIIAYEGYSYYQKNKLDFYTIKTVDGFINYTEANSNEFKIDSDNYTYGPYQLNTTENNYLFIRLNDGDDYKKIGYIKLYYEDAIKNEAFYANWYSDNVKFLCIKVKEKDNKQVHWYFFDENGNLIKISDKILDTIIDEEQQIEKNSKEIDTSQKESIELVTQTASNIIYTDTRNFGGFKIGITDKKEIIVYKNTEGNVNEIFTKVDSYVSNNNLSNNEYVNTYGPGFYADGDYSGATEIRIRVDKYLNNDETNRYGYTWYTISKSTGKILTERDFIDTSHIIYTDTRNFGGFKIGITDKKEIIVYKNTEGNVNEIFAKVDSYVSNGNLSNNEYVRKYGPGFYADGDYSGAKEIRIRVDKYQNNDETNRYGYLWYTFSKSTGKMLTKREFIDSSHLVYTDTRNFGGFNIGITDSKEIIVYKTTEPRVNEIFAKVDSYVSNSNLTNNEYVRKYGPGFYADGDSSSTKEIRIRVDKYLNNDETNRYGYLWYTFYKSTGKMLTERDFIF